MMGLGMLGGLRAELCPPCQEQTAILMFSVDPSSHLTAWYYEKKKKKVPVFEYYFHINSLQIVK